MMAFCSNNVSSEASKQHVKRLLNCIAFKIYLFFKTTYCTLKFTFHYWGSKVCRWKHVYASVEWFSVWISTLHSSCLRWFSWMVLYMCPMNNWRPTQRVPFLLHQVSRNRLQLTRNPSEEQHYRNLIYANSLFRCLT